MDISIDGKKKVYRITSDKQQFILSEQKIKSAESKTPGVIFFDEIGYFRTLDGLIERVMMLELEYREMSTLADLLTEIRAMRGWLTELVAA